LVAGLAMGAAWAWSPRRLRAVVHYGTFAVVLALCLLLIVVRTAQLTA
jgi:hypothetical protein